MTALATPARTHAQRMAGLAHANRVRVYRAEVKRNLKAGADPVAILLDPAPELLTMPARAFLMALPGLGRSKVTRMMVANSVAQSKTLGGLSERQRSALVEALS